MASSNKGKKFEHQFKISADKDGILCIRLNDSDVSFAGASGTRFAPKNPCDYVLYYRERIWTLELKSSRYSGISYSTDPEDKEKKMIKAHQINSLINFSQFKGCEAGFIFNFRNDETNEEDTYFMSIQDFSTCITSTGKKSINKLDIVQYGGIRMDQTLKRTNYIYHVKDLFDKVINLESVDEKEILSIDEDFNF